MTEAESGAAGSEESRDQVRSYLLDDVLLDADPEDLEDRTPLITGGILDSISTVRFVSFLEERFGVTFQAHEMDADHLDTIELVVATVEAKI